MTLLSVENLSVDLPRDGGAGRIVDGVSFELERGCIADLAGASGCGKSTLLRACALMAPRAGGTIRLRGRSCGDFDPARWRAQVCLIPQKAVLIPATVQENLLAPWKLAVRKGETPPSEVELRRAMDEALLGDVPLDRDASRLSGGQAARVALLRAFLTKPAVLLMDEVDAALDPESSAAVSGLTASAAERGAACLRIRHRGPDGLASRTFRMVDGRLAETGAGAEAGAEAVAVTVAVAEAAKEAQHG